MTEMKRTAGLIRSYLKAFEYGLAIAKTPRKRRAYYTNLGINARTDMPRLLDAAVRRGAVLQWLLNFPELNGLQKHHIERIKAVLDETAWLAEPSPEPAAPDSESGEGDDEK